MLKPLVNYESVHMYDENCTIENTITLLTHLAYRQ